ncbi:hypothetical protein M9435_004294 [Picochlorum sp. BPE23]|nr:hypothetical protein M9435_004294 [Picochlorum sp. BPE23]
MIVRIARVDEIRPGEKVEKECFGMRLLVVRNPHGGEYSVMDAHCFHMGMPLVGGDIEDLGNGHTCIVCPAHRYKIDMKTGCMMEKNLDGHVCAGKNGEQQQRLYNVHCDSEFVWVDIPAHPGKDLPSDVYNENNKEAMMHHGMSGGRGYGLLGPQGALPVPPGSPLQPYAGQKGYPAGSPLPDVAMDDVMDLSQESVDSTSPQKNAAPKRLDFGASAVRGPQPSVRRKAATSAILKRGYKPPSAQPLSDNGSRQKTLFETWNAVQ